MESWPKGGGNIKDFVSAGLEPYYLKSVTIGVEGCQKLSNFAWLNLWMITNYNLQVNGHWSVNFLWTALSADLFVWES